jgi:four helix bundle protein
MARGSNSEVETQLVLAQELGFGDLNHLSRASLGTAEVGKMLNAMMKNI